MNNQETYPELKRSLNLLLSKENSLNKFDYIFAKGINAKDNWTQPMAIAIYKMISKYRGQLKDLGEDYENIPIPEKIIIKKEIEKFQEIKKAVVKDNQIFLEFKIKDKEEWMKTLQSIKGLPGRQYHGDIKQWSVPVDNYNISEIQKFGFKIDKDIEKLVEENENKKEWDGRLENIKSISGKIPYKFQIEDIYRMNELDGNVLQASDMGTGKTMQSLLYLKINLELRPVLIVSPATLKLNFAREIEDWLPGESYKIVQGRSDMFTGKENIVIINYDILKYYTEILSDIDFKVLIGDECHAVKNSKAARTRALKYISKGIEHKILMTGTPILNGRPIEFFTALNMLRPELFPNWYRYAQEFCDPQEGSFGTTYSGCSNVEKLHNIIQPFMIRRTKLEVLPQLPLKTKTVLPVEINNRPIYNKAKADIVEFVRQLKGNEAAKKASMAKVLSEFSHLRQIATDGKTNHLVEWIDNFLETGEKLVVMCVHHRIIDLIMNKYESISVKLDGRDSLTKKQRSVDSFQSDPNIKIFVGNIKAAGVGITLTASNTLLFAELDFVPGLYSQAEDRICRIGQESKHIDIYYLVAENTIEEHILEIVDKKNKINTAIIDGEQVKDDNLLTELIKKYQG